MSIIRVRPKSDFDRNLSVTLSVTLPLTNVGQREGKFSAILGASSAKT